MLVRTTKPGRSSALGTEPVVDPRAHRRSAADGRAAVHERMGRVVVDLLGDHRADDADVVSKLLMPGSKTSLIHLAAWPVAVELEHRAVPRLQLLVLELCDRLALGVRLGHRLVVKLGQLRLVVERLQMRRSAGHAEEDDALGLWGKRHARQPAIGGGGDAAERSRSRLA